jgi:class 3 adenylate cyclase/tetratricopeptide (TPR) repeat protein
VICATCGSPNEPNRKFCGECGSPLASACPNCGAGNAPGVKFCGECGIDLRAAGGGPIAQPTAVGAGTGEGSDGSQAAATPTAERRLVSVLFADMVGFTTLSEDRDPELVRELLSRYFETARQIIDSYGGIVEKFIGDAVMAVWGTPVAHEDDAERAVRTGLDLVEAIKGIGREVNADLQLRAGVLTGEAAVTLGATHEGMVAGDLVNTASRLQSVAMPGVVLVGESTMEAASRAIAFEPAGEQALKGKALPVPAYRALRVVARRGGAGRSEQLEAPFVGRAPELRMLKDFHEATAAERRPRLVSIMGQGGIGKTRLVWEFQKYMDGVTEVVYWHQGRSPAYGEGISFWALAEMVRSRAGITESDDPETAQAKVRAALQEWVPDESERRWIEPRLLHLLGIEPGDGESKPDQESLFAAWRLFFERIAERGVVVLVFEDLQWADGGLLDFIDHLLEWSRDRPIYLITLARPELLDRRSDWGAGRRNFTSLVLEPLGSDEMRELLRGLIPGMPDQVMDRILARAEGIPLYAVETVRMLVSEGLVVPENDVFRPVGDLSSISVPASLHALIASRLDALDANDRSLLQAAAVIGKTFSTEALAAVSGMAADEVATRLRDLVRREMLTVEADPRSPELGSYSFVQGLIREVAYGTLARRDRRRLHIAAARYFETLMDEGIAGALAEHYVAAYRAQPEGPEGDAVAAQARVALRGAAERARSLGSAIQAVRFLERALEVTPDPGEQRELHAAAADAALQGGHLEAIPHAERAVELARIGGDRPILMATLWLRARTFFFEGRAADAVALLEPAAAEYVDLAESREYVQLAGGLAISYMLLNRHEDALRVVERTLPVAERLDLKSEALELIVSRGAVLAGSQRIQEGIAVLRGAVAMASQYGLNSTEIRGRVNLSFAAAADDPQLGYQVAREGWELVRRLGFRGWFYMLSNAVEFAIRIGDWEWALAELEEAATLEADLSAQLRLAEIRGLRGADVDADIQAVTDLVGDASEVQWPATIADVRATIALGNGDLPSALASARRSYEMLTSPDATSMQTAIRAASWMRDRDALADVLARQQELPGNVSRAATIEANAGLAALDRRPEAIPGFLDAMRRWRDMGLAFDASLCAVSFVTLTGTSSREARAAAEEARAFFERVGASGLLEQLDRASAPAADHQTASEGRGPRAAQDSAAGVSG